MQLSQDEKNSADLEWKLRRLHPMSFANETFFVVPFEQAVDLICRHRVLVQAGRAYVPRSELISLVCAHFRAHLNHELAVAFRASRAQTDVRVSSLIEHIAQVDVGVSFKSSAAAGSVRPDDISRVSIGVSVLQHLAPDNLACRSLSSRSHCVCRHCTITCCATPTCAMEADSVSAFVCLRLCA